MALHKVHSRAGFLFSFLMNARQFFSSSIFTLLIITTIGFWNVPNVRAGSPHTIIINGANDFAVDEDVPGTSGSAWYFTWDASNFYFGVAASDVAANSATKFVLLYLDSDPRQNPLSGSGTSTGVNYNTQQPGLPFNADYHFRWRTDNTFTDLMNWNGSSWVGGNNSGVSAFQSGAFVEYQIPRANLGDPSQVYVCGAMINEQGGVESTFFLTPQSNGPDGFDKDFSHYFGFPLVDNISPDFSGNEDTYPVASVATGNFSNGATWTGGVVPNNNSNAFIQNGHTVTLDASGDLKYLTIISGGTFSSNAGVNLNVANNGSINNNGTFNAGAGAVAFAGAGTVSGTIAFNTVVISNGVNFGTASTVNGTLRINTGGSVNTNPPAYGTSATLQYNTGGSYNASAEWTANASSGAGVPQNVQLSNGTALNLSSSNRTANGDITIDTGVSTLNSTSGTLTIGGNFTNNGAFNHNNGSVTFNGSGTRNVSGSATTAFNTITVNMGSSASILEVLSPITMATDGLTLTQGTFKLSSASTITPFAGATTVPGAAGYHLNHASAVSNWGSTGSLTLQGKLVVDAGTMTVGSASGNELTLNTSTSEATINGGVLNLAGRVSVTTSGAGIGLRITGGELVVAKVGNASANPGFNMGSTGRFTMTGGTVTIERATTAGGFDVQMVSGTSKSISGGTFRYGNASTPAGTPAMTINSQITFFSITVNNANGISLLSDANVSNNLTLLNGNVNANSLKMNIFAGGTVVRTSGHVVGNLQKNFAVGTNVTRSFEIGTGGDYTPVDITIASVFGAGTMMLRSTAGDHPNIATSNLNASKSVNRRWTTSGAGLSITTYSATFNFVGSDLDAGVNTNALNVGSFSGVSWTYPAMGVRTATSTQATGISAFGEFQVAEYIHNFFVTNTNNSGAGSLRQAMLNANSIANVDASTPDQINFNIPGVGPFTISPASALPAIADPVIIDGLTQLGASCTSWPPTLNVVLSGASAGGGVNGLTITAGNSTVRGLVINRFTSDGIEMSGSGNNQVECNLIGTDVTGTSDLGNSSNGVFVSNISSNAVGGAASSKRNLISGNDGDGIEISGSSAANNLVQGNSIFSNSGLGIDLANDGVTANDAGDGDSGPNKLQNFPALNCAHPGGGNTEVKGSLNSTANTAFTLEIFSNASADASGFGEGETFRLSSAVTTSGTGNVNFTVSLPAALPLGQYVSATATDPSGNTSEFSKSIIVSTELIADAGADVAICAGASTTIGGSPAATGGATPYSYSWSPATGLSNASLPNPTATPTTTTTFALTVTDVNGCTEADQVTVTVNPLPTANVSGDATICAGGSTTISAALTGASPWNLTWSDGFVQNSVTVSPATREVNPSTTTTYTVTSITDANCTGTSSGSATITVNPLPTATVSVDATICAGGSSTISAALTGASPWSLTWSDGFVQSSVTASPATRVVSPSATTTYTVTSITDANCTGTSSGSATITVNALPTATVSGDATICAGGSSMISAALTGASPWNLTWSDGFVQNGVAVSPATRVVSLSATTTYTVTSVADANCSGTSSGSATITVNPSPTATVSGDATICAGGSSTISATLSGASPWSLTWSDGFGQNGVTVSPATREVNPSTTTTYTVTSITDANCTGTSSGSATITVNPLPTATVSGDATICAGGSSTISAALTGASPWNLTWSDGNVQSGVTVSPATRIVSPPTTTTYTVTSISDANCTGTSSGSAAVTVNPLPTVSISGSDAVVTGTTHTYTANTNASSPSYDWNVTNGTINGSNTNNSVSVTAGTVGTMVVNLTVTDGATTCGNSATKNVAVNPNTLMANAGADDSVCLGSPFNLNGTATGGSGNYTFLWSVQSGPNTNSSQFSNTALEDPIFTPTLTGSYVLRFTVDDGVVSPVFDDVQITVHALPTATVSGDATICSGESATISAVLTGASPWNLTWSDGFVQNGVAASPATRVVNSTTTTTYTVTNVTDANSCSNAGTGDAEITINPSPTATVSGDATICTGGSTTISAALTGASPWNLTWSDGNVQNGVTVNPATRVVSPSATTTYTVTSVSDANCTGTSSGSAAVSVNPLPTVNITGDDPVVTGTSHAYTANTNAGEPSYNWDVTNGAINGSNTNNSVSVTAGTAGTMVVSLTVTDGATTCSNGATKNVTVNPNTLMANAGNDVSGCIGSPFNLNGTVSGGDGTYTFLWSVQSGPNTSSAQFNNPALEDPIFTPTLVGNYVLRFTVDDGVVAPVFDEVGITVHALPTATVSGDATICAGASATIVAALTGASPWNLTWSDGFDQNNVTTSPATRVVNPASTTTFTVTNVTDANNCSNTGAGGATITVDPLPSVSISGDSPVVTGTTHTYTANTNASSPSYNWGVTNGTINGSNVSSSVSATAGSIGTMVVNLTVTDGVTNCPKNASENVTVNDEPSTTPGFVFIADKFVNLDSHNPSEGDIHSNGNIQFKKGKPSTYTGSLTAVSDITIHSKNTVNGNVKAGGHVTVQNGATVNGNIIENAPVAVMPLPNLSFTAGGSNHIVPVNGSLTLAPGTYGNVVLRKNATLNLSSGDYYFNTLDTGVKSTLAMNVAGDMVNVNVVSKLSFDKETEVTTSSGDAGSEDVTFNTLQGSRLNIGEKAKILGTINASNAAVTLARNSRFQGILYADEISVSPGVTFQPHGASTPLPTIQDDLEIEDSVTEEQVASVITDYELSAIYPNPFNPTATISFALPEAGNVTVKIYAITGQLVRQLASGNFASGRHDLIWEAKDEKGAPVASGIYFYQLVVQKQNGSVAFTATRRMTLIK